MTTAFVDFNGVVPEKFDAVRLSHLINAEYGNQGIDFKMVPREGFGWMNGTSELLLYSFPILNHVPALRSHIPSWPIVPYESHAPRCRSMYLARGLFRSHNDCRTSPSATNDALGLAMENLKISPTISGLGSVTPPPS